MGELKWICPKCGSEETVVLQPAEKDGLLEFEYEGKTHRSPTTKKDDIMLFCTTCRHREIIKEYKYQEACIKSQRSKTGNGCCMTAEIIATGVAIGIVAGSIATLLIVGFFGLLLGA
jgi:hypothetical protein